MSQISGPERARLRQSIVRLYEGPNPAERFWLFLSENLDINLWELTSDKSPFPLQVSEALSKLNSSGKMPDLLDELAKANPTAASLLEVVSELRIQANLSRASAAVADRLRALESSYLLCDGFPFINRSQLRKILEQLCDASNPARVGIVTGTALSGKTWSVHFIRAYCKTLRQPKVRCIFLDLEKLQPGDNPLIVWTDLMKRLLYPEPPSAAPPADTKGGQYVQRLVDEVSLAWEAWEAVGVDDKPSLLVVFDHLEKNAAPAVGPAVVDFAEALAMAAVDRRLGGGRVLLLGFPRRFSASSQELDVAELALREKVSPLTLDEVKSYLKQVGIAIGRGAPPEVEAAADLALREAEVMSLREERRAVLLRLSATIGRHVSVLAKAL